MASPEQLTPDEVGALLKVPTTTLAGWRQRGTGPKFIRLGHRTVRYPLADVQQWLREAAGNSIQPRQ